MGRQILISDGDLFLIYGKPYIMSIEIIESFLSNYKTTRKVMIAKPMDGSEGIISMEDSKVSAEKIAPSNK